MMTLAQARLAAVGEAPIGHSDTDPMQARAHRAWYGFAAIDAGDPDKGDPLDTGAVDAIANVLHALMLGAEHPLGPRMLRAIVERAVEHAEAEVAECAR